MKKVALIVILALVVMGCAAEESEGQETAEAVTGSAPVMVSNCCARQTVSLPVTTTEWVPVQRTSMQTFEVVNRPRRRAVNWACILRGAAAFGAEYSACVGSRRAMRRARR